VKRKTAESVSNAIIHLLKPLSHHVKTLTSDNGKEFADHKAIAQALNADFYFAHPYASWERGLNENTNGLIRQYFPKNRDFTTITQKQINHVIGHNFAIFLDVQKGFEINTFIKRETFFALINALKTDSSSDNRFDANQFFSDFDKNVPEHANPHNTATTSDVVRYYSNIEEADKIHFCGWLDNNLRKHSVTDSNLSKTRRLMGQEVHDFAKRRNQSTRWTHDETMAIEFYFPD